MLSKHTAFDAALLPGYSAREAVKSFTPSNAKRSLNVEVTVISFQMEMEIISKIKSCCSFALFAGLSVWGVHRPELPSLSCSSWWTAEDTAAVAWLKGSGTFSVFQLMPPGKEGGPRGKKPQTLKVVTVTKPVTAVFFFSNNLNSLRASGSLDSLLKCIY